MSNDTEKTKRELLDICADIAALPEKQREIITRITLDLVELAKAEGQTDTLKVPAPNAGGELLEIGEVAKRLGWADNNSGCERVRRLIRAGALEAARVGKSYLVKPADVAALLETRAAETKARAQARAEKKASGSEPG